jgi:arylsulfatase A-like enzyme
MPHRRPNIALILADDMGYGDLSCLNPGSNFRTPHMDRLAEEGMRLTDAHSNSAVCTPTRYGILTGRYCWRTRLSRGVLWGYGPPLIDADRLTLPGFLRHQGYRTACIGKWHLGMDWDTTDGEEPERNGWNVDYAAGVTNGPTARGFDYYFGISASNNMPPYCFIENDHVVGSPTERKSPIHDAQHPAPMVPGWSDEAVGPTLTQKAQGWLADHHRQHPDRPFFLYLPSEAPHRPCVPPDRFRGKSGAGRRGDMVLEFDWTVGQIKQTLEELEVAENTLFIVTSDNGARPGDPLEVVQEEIGPDPEIVSGCVTYGHRSNHIYRGQKADIWDGGHRIPLLVSWPGQIPQGTRSDEITCLTDIFATVAELLDCSLPSCAAEDSFSFLRVLRGEGSEMPVRSHVIHHSLRGMFAVRNGRWKLIPELGSGGFTKPPSRDPAPGEASGRLYDMQDDPSETRNLYEKRPDMVSRLRSILEKARENDRTVPQ